MNMTLDGFLSGPSCELDWHFESWSNDMAASLVMQLARADTILLGRVTYTAMAAYWTARALDTTCPREDLAFIDMMNTWSKVVVSATKTLPRWGNTTILQGDLKTGIFSLKHEEGKDIVLYGSGKLVTSLASLRLVDEYQLWIHPIAIGKGKPLFQNLPANLPLHPISKETFTSGVVLLIYECK
jgi:dihydrofolate reductase